MKVNIFIFGLVIITLSACNSGTDSEKTEMETSNETTSQVINLLAGTYTSEDGSKGIYKLAFDPNEGILENEGLVAEGHNPSFLAISQDNQRVYTVNETDSGMVSAFQWEGDKLNLINQVSSRGQWPCYLDLSQSGNKISIANYGSGNTLIYDLDDNGAIIDTPAEAQHEGSGPNAERQEGPHAHFASFNANDRFVFAVDLGIDQILAYEVSDEGIANSSTAIQLEGGDGPRHLAFHPSKAFAYVVNELSSSVVAMAYNATNGTFESIDRKSTLPEGYEGENSCADIHVAPDGKFLYLSNRGHNSIAIYGINEDGTLSFLGTEDVKGDWPRNFTLSPDGQFVLVANQRSNNITVFKRDTTTGLLTYTNNQTTLGQPVCLKFFH